MYHPDYKVDDVNEKIEEYISEVANRLSDKEIQPVVREDSVYVKLYGEGQDVVNELEDIAKDVFGVEEYSMKTSDSKAIIEI
jgi:hypothetical protein